MRKLFTILFLFLSLIVSADKWYIATAANGGSDTDGDGSIAYPWLTLKHATDTVTGANFVGDTITIGAGTFTETAQIIWDENVYIIGVIGYPLTSIIESNYADTTLIKAESVDGTDGDQSISYIRFDGDALTGSTALEIVGRSNVIVHHCEFEDFLYAGVIFRGDTEWGPPDIYATGNEFHHNKIINCSGCYFQGTYYVHLGNLMIGGQGDILIYNDTIISEDRGVNLWGFPIKFSGGGYNMGVKIYDSHLICPEKNGSDWSFAIELFDSRGGVEIMRNTCQGTIDFSANSSGTTNDAGGFGYAVKVYDNYVYYPTGTSDYVVGIDFERSSAGGCYIYRNHVYNFGVGFSTNVAATETMEDMYVSYNKFEDCGRNSSTFAYGFAIGGGSGTFDNINILNNVVEGRLASSPTDGIRFNCSTATHVKISNNIVTDFLNGYSISILGIINGINVENNITYNCGSLSDIDTTSATLTTDVIENNQFAVNPLFLYTNDFHLQATSPAIDAGVDVELTEDYEGNIVPFNGIPDIGAYEYGSYIIIPGSEGTQFGTGTGNNLMVDKNGRIIIIQ